ncbi:predicted protein [Histoplasma mississippiense (nom. inval.)]|uniref:predicted protein n=1 Tax=Ajellomyces capsulatus (strain NAm1 / WU24) TaxID=2059318 RepID=UPI000157C225|nr:predicted protein [Histoplasma mississippiense (nom. inval.)]EDN07837.1 predicted protein [Histoplasma mississippiense (nom. inval.)]
MSGKDVKDLLDLIAAFKSNLQHKQFYQAEKLVQKTAPILHKLGAFSLTDSVDDKLFCLAREALELSTITSLRLGENDPKNQVLFTTGYKLLKPFYDREQALQMAKDPALQRLNPSASQRNKITALYLVYLLKFGGFVGTNKIAEEFEIFSPVLLSTIRMWMAASAEKAYESLSISSAKDVLKLDSEGDVVEFAQARGWVLRDGRIYFPQSEVEHTQGSETSVSHASRAIIENGIGYAQQLGTIV